MITIGPIIEYDYKPRIPKRRAKVETPFDFVALDIAIATVMGYEQVVRRAVKLHVTLPGGSAAKKWLMNHRLNSSSSVAARMVPLPVEKITIATERGIPLHRSLTLLLADWILKVFMTGELRKVRLEEWVITDPNEMLAFEKRIKEVREDALVYTPLKDSALFDMNA
jgi:hypothetical protein